MALDSSADYKRNAARSCVSHSTVVSKAARSGVGFRDDARDLAAIYQQSTHRIRIFYRLQNSCVVDPVTMLAGDIGVGGYISKNYIAKIAEVVTMPIAGTVHAEVDNKQKPEGEYRRSRKPH
jgi:hypothetical protein